MNKFKNIFDLKQTTGADEVEAIIIKGIIDNEIRLDNLDNNYILMKYQDFGTMSEDTLDNIEFYILDISMPELLIEISDSQMYISIALALMLLIFIVLNIICDLPYHQYNIPFTIVALAGNEKGLCVVALNKNLKLTTTLDRAITQSPCYVPFLFGI